MHKSNKLAFANLWQFAIDILFILFSYILAYLFTSMLTSLSRILSYIWILYVFIPIWLLSMASLGMYNKTTFTYYDRTLRHIFFSSIISGLSLATTMFFIKKTMFSRLYFELFMIITVALITIERYIYVYYLKKNRNVGAKKVIIIGDTELASKYIYFLKKTTIQIDIVGYVHISEGMPIKAKKNLGSIEELEDILKQNVIDEVIFAPPRNYLGVVERYVLLCEQMGLVVRVLLNLYDVKISKMHLTSIGPIPMVTFHSVTLNKFQLSIKRFIDIVGSIVGLLLTGILSIFIILAIKLNSKGPILFKQDRVGQNGRIFKLYKFRSMTTDAEERKKELKKLNQVDGGLMFKVKNDPRITKVGCFLRKTSLDELPQFLNVFKGEMSLVGTRPPTLDEVEKYKAYHHRRISIKPGITGLWQVSGRSKIHNFDDVVKLDTEYIDNWSIWLDVKIIIKTLLVVFIRKGAM